jgi:uncharacterized protein YyaL (SSP411 family)
MKSRYPIEVIMPNRLANENSPYLLQHAENPVDWCPWGEEALEKARAEDKPIFLSVGYAACHWCHVMEHESFEDEDTAAIMNEHFVNIKVDREERPDIDSIYMQAVVAMTRQGGWPMSVFLTPDGKPFFGGTYFPPVRRYNMPSFKEILFTIARLWREDRDQLLESSEQISRHLQGQERLSQGQGNLGSEVLDQASKTLAQGYDWVNGGWGQAPKFPQPMAIEFLLRKGTRKDQSAIDMAVHALHAMAKGGLHDVVGGGFARYSVDDRWHVPHFEKMLYDNAQLALVYLHAFLITGERAFRQVCENTLDFILREMTHPEGGFYSSLDADSEGKEGKFYVWTPQEILEVIDEPMDTSLLMSAYGITDTGNFEGKNILQRVSADEQLSETFNLPLEGVSTKLAELHTVLLEARSRRIRPGTDDKVLVFWNALMLAAFSEAGRYLGREDYKQAAIRNATFLIENLYQGDRLLRSWREGQAKYNAYLEDYAGLVLGLLALYQTDPDPHWYQFALKLADEMIAHFPDPDGGFFDTRDDHETLLLRPKDLQDNATPSGNALAALALLKLSVYGDRMAYRDLAEAMLIAIQDAMVRYPAAFAQWLCAVDFALGPTHEVVILGDIEDPDTQSLVNTLWKAYRPRLVTGISTYPSTNDAPALLGNRPLINNRPTAYVCQGFVCRKPVNSPEKLTEQLDNIENHT